MARGFNAAKFNREVRAAQRKAEADWKRKIARVNRENQREVDRVNRENKRRVEAYNRKVDQHNAKVVADLNRQLRAATSGPGTPQMSKRLLIGSSTPPRSVKTVSGTRSSAMRESTV